MSSLRSDASVRAPEFVEPAFFTRPDFTDSIGEEVADFAAACGFPPDPEQRMVLSAMFAGPAGVSYRTRDRKWYSSQVAVICSRQNLKTACMEMGVLGALWLLDARLVLWTSHIFNPAAAETFFHFKQLIDENAHLSRRVKRIHDASGRESIELMNGARLKFLARSKATGRALSGDLVILDEAYALSTAEVGALLPTRSARPNSQVWYGSSAGRIESEQLRLIRDRGREGADRMTYVEWCSTKSCASDRCTHNVGEIGCVLDDHDEWRKANPALGRRIDIETVQDERISMSPQEFARERLGWWDGAGAGRVIPIGRWAANASSGGIVGDVAVFVDVTIDRSESVIAVCGADADGVPQVELARVGDGTDWVVPKVAAMLSEHRVLALGARSAGPVASLLAELKSTADDASVPFHKVGSGEFSGMCGGFWDAAMTGQLRHRDDARLNAALAAAKKHRVVDGWSWERLDVDTDAAPLVAATGAHAVFLLHKDEVVSYDAALSVY